MQKYAYTLKQIDNKNILLPIDIDGKYLIYIAGFCFKINVFRDLLFFNPN